MNQTENESNKGGDDDRFLRLFRAYQDSIYAFIYTLVHNDIDAEDIMQEVTMIMWRKFGTYQDGTSFTAWGIAIAKNIALQFYSTQSRHDRLFLPELQNQLIEKAAHIVFHQDERISHLRECLKKLNPRDRAIIQKRYYNRISTKAIAQESQIAPHTMYRVVAKIHTFLLLCVQRGMTGGGAIS